MCYFKSVSIAHNLKKVMRIVYTLAIVFLCHFNFVTSKKCFKTICIPSGYDRLINPPTKNATTEVLIRFINIQIIDIDENRSRITLKLTIVMNWVEPRIFISANASEEDKKPLIKSFMILPKDFVNLLWLPDAYIPDVHDIKKYKFVHEFEEFYYNLENRIASKVEVEIVLLCKMKFEDFPMDENACFFALGSYSPLEQSAQHFSLLREFKNRLLDPIVFNISTQATQLDFTIDIKEALPRDVDKTREGIYYFQRSGFKIIFKRKISGYITSYYFPSGILVVLSWVSCFSS